MRIETIPVHRINPAPYNPRRNLQPGDPEYERISRSVWEFGLVEPLVWNERTGTLVGGHQRFKVLLAQGAETVIVSVVERAGDDLVAKYAVMDDGLRGGNGCPERTKTQAVAAP